MFLIGGLFHVSKSKDEKFEAGKVRLFHKMLDLRYVVGEDRGGAWRPYNEFRPRSFDDSELD